MYKILNIKLSKRATIISLALLAVFVAYVFYVAYGMQKAISYYHSTIPASFYK